MSEEAAPRASSLAFRFEDATLFYCDTCFSGVIVQTGDFVAGECGENGEHGPMERLPLSPTALAKRWKTEAEGKDASIESWRKVARGLTDAMLDLALDEGDDLRYESGDDPASRRAEGALRSVYMLPDSTHVRVLRRGTIEAP